MRIKLKSDKYKKARGGPSKLLSIKCSTCKANLFFYQKDGPGLLKRVYLDRIYKPVIDFADTLKCSECNKVLGTKMIYEKENRLAYRLHVGAISKSVSK
jgi:phage FluMu protein Com